MEPIFDNQILPAIWTVAVLADVGVEKMGIRNQPGIIIGSEGIDIGGY